MASTVERDDDGRTAGVQGRRSGSTPRRVPPLICRRAGKVVPTESLRLEIDGVVASVIAYSRTARAVTGVFVIV